MGDTLQVSKDKVNRLITDIVNELIKLHNEPSIDNVITYSNELGKLEGICKLVNVDMDKIMKKAGLE
ncbi:hypothetical protein [Niallia sp. BSM11]|uniref:hypothetical protein n=1 Tax=Niallia sp. BSM11 TaxID=3391576 RepID=UPI0039850B98